MGVRQGIAVAAAVVAAVGIAAPAASAAFGVSDFKAEVRKSNTPGDLETQAGATPFTGVTDFSFNRTLLQTPDGNVKDIRVDLPPGLVSNPQATPKCTDDQFPSCPPATQLGTEQIYTAGGLPLPVANVYNMVPKPGQVSLFAFDTLLGRTDIVGGIRDHSDYGLFFTISDTPQSANLTQSVLTFFGRPAAQNGGGGAPTSFITLPTSCSGPQTTKLTVTSWAAETATATATTPTGATGCDALPFAPAIAATTHAANRGGPAGLTVKLSQAAGEANVKSVSVTLPAALGVRLETLKNACPEATFQADPATCPPASRVGSTSATTPLLAAPLTGDVYLEAHAAGKLPTLQAILHGPGLQVALTGSIDLSHGVTSTFDGIPDLPISEFVLSLDGGAGSPLAVTADMCAAPLTLSSSITAQSGKVQSGQAPVAVAGCSVAVLARKVSGKRASVTLRVPSAGRVTLSGKGVRTTTVSARGAGTVTAHVTLSSSGAKTLRKNAARHRALVVRLRAAFTPAQGAAAGGEPVIKSSRLARLIFRSR